MNKQRWMIAGSLFLIISVFIAAAYQMNKDKKGPVLPVYGWDEKTMKTHTVGDFSLINQDGKTITQNDIAGHIYVANFFFATCKGICPLMNSQLSRVYQAYKTNDKVLFLSHTVKPEEDSVPALKAYSKLFDADASRWWFLTGDKKQIYNLARNDYLASISEGNGGPDDFVHTQLLLLIDTQHRIRGFYDGLDSVQVTQLIGDVNRLLSE
ncbi:hypothetical protein BH11BAC2_BH11BAC2_26310 [soil metagenome]